MKRLCAVILLVSALGCEALDVVTGVQPDSPKATEPARPAASEQQARLPEPPPKKAPRLRPKADLPPVVESYAVCTVDILSLPRTQAHEMDPLFTYAENGGIYGPEEKVLALNGLRVARSDMRFKDPFAKALATARAGSKRMTYVRLPEGKAQSFELGESLKDVSLFVWTSPDAVLGRYFTQARYALALSLEKVSPEGRVEYGLSWQVQTGAAFQRVVTIPSLDMHVELEPGQSLIIAPTGVSGRSVDRALLTGVEEATVQVTFLVVTPIEARAKPVPKPKPEDTPDGEAPAP